jgi:L-arabinose transport system substrate-binding protein
MHKSLSWLAVGAATIVVAAACTSTATPAPTVAPTPAPTAAATEAATPAPPATATSAPTQAGKPLFVAINKSADQVYFIDLQKGFTEKITQLGGEAKVFNAKLEPELGINLVNDAISAGAKGIAITVPDQTIGPAIAKAAKDAGVALVATDDSIKDEAGNPVPFVGFDGKDMGKKVGEAAAKMLQDYGWLKDPAKKVGVLSVEVQTLSVCNDRTDNEKAAVIAAGVPKDNVYPVPYTGETPSAQDAAGPIITAHPDVTNWIVFGCNDEGVLGVLNALATAGVKTDNILGVGLGAYLACVPWAANQPSGFKAALLLAGSAVGKTAAQELWDNVINGTPLPPFKAADTVIVTPAELATVQAGYPCK